MRNLKRLATSLVALVLVIAFSSCEKQPTSDALQEVSFNVKNVTNLLSKKAVGPNDEKIPDCVDSLPSYVVAKINGTDYKLNVLSGLNDGTETQVIKLDAGSYSLESFKVYAQGGTMIWATPEAGSYYANLWNLQGVAFDFDVTAFTKTKIDIDVLCWEPYFYEDFGFNWFDFQEIKIKTICFFGDVCTPNYTDWGMTQYDFVARYRVEIYDPVTGIMVGEGNNLQMEGPLCIEYPEFGDRTDETYNVMFYLQTPLGEIPSPYSLHLNADTGLFDEIGANDINGNLDEDGIFDFVLVEGENCNYTGNEGVNAVLGFNSDTSIAWYIIPY